MKALSFSFFLQSSYKAFSQKILKLLAHDSRMVVVSSLILVGYLEERLRDTVRFIIICRFINSLLRSIKRMVTNIWPKMKNLFISFISVVDLMFTNDNVFFKV